VIVLALEWMQRIIPGRYPDVTAVLIAFIGLNLVMQKVVSRKAPRGYLSFDRV
jgi:VanZ family protein